MTTDKKRNLIIGASWSIILLLMIYANIGFLQLIIGLPFALFLPGYLLLNALSINNLSVMRKFTLSFGASIILLGLLGLVLNFTQLGLKPLPVYLSLILLVISLAAISPSRNSPTPILPQTQISTLRLTNYWNQIGKFRRYTLLISFFSIVGIISLVIWRLATIQPGEKFTEFYVLDQNRLAESSSLELISGEKNYLVVGIINHEQAEQIYYFDMLVAKEIIYKEEPFTLQPGQQYEQAIQVILPQSAVNRDVTFRLYKWGNKVPYRTLLLREGNFIIDTLK